MTTPYSDLPLIEALTKIAAHLEDLDSGSGEAKVMRGAIARIIGLERALDQLVDEIATHNTKLTEMIKQL